MQPQTQLTFRKQIVNVDDLIELMETIQIFQGKPYKIFLCGYREGLPNMFRAVDTCYKSFVDNYDFAARSKMEVEVEVCFDLF